MNPTTKIYFKFRQNMSLIILLTSMVKIMYISLQRENFIVYKANNDIKLKRSLTFKFKKFNLCINLSIFNLMRLETIVDFFHER